MIVPEFRWALAHNKFSTREDINPEQQSFNLHGCLPTTTNTIFAWVLIQEQKKIDRSCLAFQCRTWMSVKPPQEQPLENLVGYEPLTKVIELERVQAHRNRHRIWIVLDKDLGGHESTTAILEFGWV